MMVPGVVRTVTPQCTENKCLLDKRQAQKAPLNHNDFLASVWRGFLYTPEASTLPPCSLDRSRHWGSYRTPRLGYGSGANAANIMRHWPAPSPSSYGGDASSDKLRAGARCTKLRRESATLQRPGWAGNNVGFYPFPTEDEHERCASQGNSASSDTHRGSQGNP